MPTCPSTNGHALLRKKTPTSFEPSLRLYSDDEGTTGIEFDIGGRRIDTLALDKDTTSSSSNSRSPTKPTGSSLWASSLVPPSSAGSSGPPASDRPPSSLPATSRKTCASPPSASKASPSSSTPSPSRSTAASEQPAATSPSERGVAGDLLPKPLGHRHPAQRREARLTQRHGSWVFWICASSAALTPRARSAAGPFPQ